LVTKRAPTTFSVKFLSDNRMDYNGAMKSEQFVLLSAMFPDCVAYQIVEVLYEAKGDVSATRVKFNHVD
jgi:hypothetical protein